MNDCFTTEDYKKAIEYARGMVANGGNYEKQKFAQVVIEALRKGVPMKPIHTYKKCGFIVEGCCPICGESVVYGEGCRNNKCRQSIDWSDTE